MRSCSHAGQLPGWRSAAAAPRGDIPHRVRARSATRRRNPGKVEMASLVCEGCASESEELQVVLRRRAPGVVGALAALCLSAAACTPAGPSTPSPTPTPSASPTETQLEKQTRLDFEAAEKAYRTFSAEFDRLRQQGYAGEPTQVLKDNGAGPYLAEAATVLRKQYEAKARSAGSLTIGS